MGIVSLYRTLHHCPLDNRHSVFPLFSSFFLSSFAPFLLLSIFLFLSFFLKNVLCSFKAFVNAVPTDWNAFSHFPKSHQISSLYLSFKCHLKNHFLREGFSGFLDQFYLLLKGPLYLVIFFHNTYTI